MAAMPDAKEPQEPRAGNESTKAGGVRRVSVQMSCCVGVRTQQGKEGDTMWDVST